MVMAVHLMKIQPMEEYLDEESVNFFMQNPQRIFKEEEKIVVRVCHKRPFDFYAFNGNNRLFMCYKLDIPKVPVVPKFINSAIEEDDLRLVDKAYRRGIQTWKDLENRIVKDRELHYP